ncbi:hypothetical protein J4Q44_G00369530 [Coregonus suidteri]|uniref:Uncharacterized protein n=1 Tax=Coregonus suidteri TaxID=861788 RepID=A0AAN8Q5I6_9TELE
MCSPGTAEQGQHHPPHLDWRCLSVAAEDQTVTEHRLQTQQTGCHSTLRGKVGGEKGRNSFPCLFKTPLEGARPEGRDLCILIQWVLRKEARSQGDAIEILQWTSDPSKTSPNTAQHASPGEMTV